jgi:glycosyltransferase involved in cell wall biosynthesis
VTPLYYAGQPGDGFGWGIANRYLRAELSKLREVIGPEVFDGHKWTTNEFEFPKHHVFMPLADHNFEPISKIRGRKNLAYTFFEFPLGPNAKKNARKYDVVFCGSTWCLTQMMARGITNGHVLVQGVDRKVFHPKPNPRQDGEFWIFSGGKFEYRKGQDLVLAAFKEICKRHHHVKLVTAWQNPWPQLCETMRESTAIRYDLSGRTWKEQLGSLCRANGIAADRVLSVDGIIPNKEMADVYRMCDVGLFPNRCEGGTNLVAMEFMACGRSIVTHSLTGHADIWNPGMMLHLAGQNPKTLWAESKVEDIVAALDRAITMQPEPRQRLGEIAAEAMKQWTWERAAKTVVSYL